MTQLANHLAGHGVPVTVVVADVPSTGDSPHCIARLSASYPAVSFHLLPPATTRSEDAADPNADPFITLIADIRATNAALLAFLRSLPSVKALITDFFCAYGLDAAAELGVPAYVFFTLCVSALATFLHIPVMRSAVSFGEMGRSLLHFPGVHPIPASDLPEVLLDRDNRQYSTTLGLFKQLPRAKGILSNTFEWLEPRAVKAIKEGIPRPGESLPKLFCVGPLVGEERGSNADHDCLVWLDKQPAGSVAFRAGVPMLCWPMYAEQRMNKVFVVEEMKLGVAMNGYDEAMVKAEEVEAKVRLVMESEQGNEIRQRMTKAREIAANALEIGGSSVAAIVDLLDNLKISTND
uniref:Anthocyanidin 5,3-O-glucosyltransferase n=1 Tax=Aegilops tauschii TaxID=37682 RepID=M8BTZ2_AEGTA